MLDLSCAFSCRYTANAPPVSRSGITPATSLMSRSLHTSSTFSSNSTTDCWGDPSNSGINRKSSDLSTPFPLPMAAAVFESFCALITGILYVKQLLQQDIVAYDKNEINEAHILVTLIRQYQFRRLNLVAFSVVPDLSVVDPNSFAAF
ncbi:hypothetical protein T03_15598 [Trichinella britovi]|uniref:Uncharacterized protein n=1 Tax=Trichinella britovi TaxID=45882 RepID=A0A0V1CHF7_TRIBR|nr:hypothetical protein T03_15598 [Trichinella britovi]